MAVQVSRDTDDKPQFDACNELFNIAERLVPDEFCKNKGYDRSKADAGKYAEAVLGKKGIVDCNGVAIAHVGAAAVSNEERHWEPWTGFRTVRPNIRGPSCQVGSTIRNRFCFNTQELDERSRLRAERIKLIVGEAADAAHLSNHVGPDTDKLFDIDDTARGDECDVFDECFDADPFGHGFGNRDDSDDLYEGLFDDVSEPRQQEDSANEDEVFWHSLDEDAAAVPDAVAVGVLDLFHYGNDLDGLCDAIVDVTDGLLDGSVVFSDHLFRTIERCVATITGVATSSDVEASSSTSPTFSAQDRLGAIRERIARKELCN